MPSVTDTAIPVAWIRAAESALPPGERLFDDPYGHLFSVGAESSEVTAHFMAVPFMREQIRLRTRLIDDAVREGLVAGLRQVLILGVGFDCRSLRLREIAKLGARVWEVDFASQLRRKREILAAAAVEQPAGVSTLACDFTDADYETGLRRDLAVSGFDASEAAMVVWEGVVGYLSDEDIQRGLRFAASVGGRSSRIVFNYTAGRLGPELVDRWLHAAGFTQVAIESLDVAYRRLIGPEPPFGGELFRVAIARVE